MPITGYSADLPADVIVDSGVLYVGTAIVGVTRGGLAFDPGKSYRNIPFDGVRSPIKGLDRIEKYDAKLTGTILEFDAEEFVQLEPGSTNDAGTPTTIITMKAASTLLASGDYLTDVRLVMERGGGGYAAVHFSVGLLTQYSVKTSDNSEAEIAITIEARLDMAVAATPSVCPYKIELRTAVPS